MGAGRRHGWALAITAFAAGLAVRVWWLPAWGTFDIEVQKAWSARAATHGVASIYGPPDRELVEAASRRGGWLPGQLATMPIPKETFEWRWGTFFVDYPPGSILVLWAAGKLYGWLAPGLPNGPGFNAAVNVAPLLASLAIAALLYCSAPGEPGTVRAAAFWLNPAVILAAPVLGYQDPIFAAFGLAAVLALMRGRHAAAAALVVIAGLVKPQGALLVPTLLVMLAREGRPAAWLRSALAGAAAAAVVLAPWWSQGFLVSALDGCRRPLDQGTLAPLGFNAWWIAGYVMQWAERGPWPLAEVASLGEFHGWSGWDPRLLSRWLLAAGTLANVAWLARRPAAPGRLADRHVVPLSVILQVHLYALVGTSVHENHTFLAVALAPLLLGSWPRGALLLAGTSAFLFANLFLAAGLGRRVTTLRFLAALRSALGLDLSVIVAAAHVGLVALIVLWTLRTSAVASGPDARIAAE